MFLEGDPAVLINILFSLECPYLARSDHFQGFTGIL
jgi:hypothetical protein